MTIKKGDTIQVIAGREKGKKGIVEKVFPATSKVVVAGVNIRKHHIKPTQNRPKGGIVDFAAPLARANVMIVCPHCSKPTRVKHTEEQGSKYRYCSKCQGSLDSK